MTAFVSLALSNVALAALLAMVVWLVTRLWRSPQLAHLLWMLVLLKLITPPLAVVSLPEGFAADTPGADALDDSPALPRVAAETRSTAPRPTVDDPQDVFTSAVPAAVETDRTQSVAQAAMEAQPRSTADGHAASGRDVAATSGVPWREVLLAVWLAGSGVYLWHLTWQTWRFRRTLARAESAPNELTAAAGRLAARLGLQRCPRVLVLEARVPPLVWSLGLRPRIVLPAGLLDDLDCSQRDAVIAHELAHVRRRDHLVRWLEVLVLVPFWWNPVAWFARARLREAEEACCDAWVVWAMPSERRSYGRAMVKTIEFLTDAASLPAPAGSALGGSAHKRRIEMILNRDLKHRTSWAAGGLVTLLALGVLPVAAQNTPPVALGNPPAAKSAKEKPNRDDGLTPSGGSSQKTEAAPTEVPESQYNLHPDADVAPGAGTDETPEAILQRLKKLEQDVQRIGLGQDTSHAVAVRRPRGNRSDAGSSAIASPLPSFEVSPDAGERVLQERLFVLDRTAAKVEFEAAKREFDRRQALSREGPVVPAAELEKQRAALLYKEIQLQRAETVLELFKRQAQRASEAAERRSARLREALSSGEQESAAQREGASATLPAVSDARLRAIVRDKLVRLAAENKLIAAEVERLEILMQRAPASPRTWQAVEHFLKSRLEMSDEDTQAELKRLRTGTPGNDPAERTRKPSSK